MSVTLVTLESLYCYKNELLLTIECIGWSVLASKHQQAFLWPDMGFRFTGLFTQNSFVGYGQSPFFILIRDLCLVLGDIDFWYFIQYF